MQTKRNTALIINLAAEVSKQKAAAAVLTREQLPTFTSVEQLKEYEPEDIDSVVRFLLEHIV